MTNEELDHLEQLEADLFQAKQAEKQLTEIKEYLWPNQTGLPNEHRNALVAIQARERLLRAQIYEGASMAFEEWFEEYESERVKGGADALPHWVTEKMSTAWHAAKAAMAKEIAG